MAKASTVDAEIAALKKSLKMFTTAKLVKYWLDTGSELLNAVFGSKELGIPYGKIFEVWGAESAGKTSQLLRIAAMAQKDGAKIGVLDLEQSWDPTWATKLGLDAEQVYVFQPEIGKTGTDKEEHITTAQEIFMLVEKWILSMKEKNPDGRIVLIVDSIAAVLTEEEEAAGIQEQNMRTMVSTSSFLSKLFRRWVVVAANANVMMFCINQIRMTPGGWGNPETTPGGKALKHYAAIRVRFQRKGKKILKNGKAVGIKGTMANWKNKAGGGSREGEIAGYKFYYIGKAKYVDADEIKSEAGE